MKVEELMIGDWVRIANVESNLAMYRDARVRVCEIYKFNDYEKINVRVGGNTYKVEVSEELEPIPLTPDILEKNGFRVVYEGELHTSYFQDIDRFHAEIKVDKVGIYQHLSMRDGLGDIVEVVECKYVHQLQHILRFLGIQKDIKL